MGGSAVKSISKVGKAQWFITDPMISPDGKRLAAGGGTAKSGSSLIYDIVSGAKTRLTNEAAQERHSTWSPKGDRVVYSMRKNNQADLYLRKAMDPEELLYFPTTSTNTIPPGLRMAGTWLITLTIPRRMPRHLLCRSHFGSKTETPGGNVFS